MDVRQNPEYGPYANMVIDFLSNALEYYTLQHGLSASVGIIHEPNPDDTTEAAFHQAVRLCTAPNAEAYHDGCLNVLSFAIAIKNHAMNFENIRNGYYRALNVDDGSNE